MISATATAFVAFLAIFFGNGDDNRCRCSFKIYCLPNIINSLFKTFDFKHKSIDIKYWESYGDKCKLDFNEFDNLSNDQTIKELANEENEIYPFIRSKTSLKEVVETYNDFINSEYDLSLVIIDRRNIEICSKSQEYLNDIVKNFSECNLENKKIKLLDNINLDAKLKCWCQKTDINIYD